MDVTGNPKSLSSPETEMSVIGSMFRNDEALTFSLAQLDKEDFTEPVYKDLFPIIKKDYEDHGVLDIYSIEAKIKNHEKYNEYTTSIKKSINFCDPSNIEIYCGKLKKLTTRRNIYFSSIHIEKSATDLNYPEDKLFNDIEKLQEAEYVSNPDVARTSSQIREDNKIKIPELVTGIKEWDEWFYLKGGRGLGTTELIFARPGHGKTFYLFKKIGQLAMNGNMGLHFHLEDIDIEASERIDAVINPFDYKELNDNILVIDKHKYLHDIVKDLRYYKHKYGIKWASFDHLGRIAVAGLRANEILETQIESTRKLTDACKELDVLGLICIQPNKSYKGRTGWDNLLREEDLKGATEIFEDAFVVTTLLRPNIYPELRVGTGVDAEVKAPDGKTTVNYDSVFATQIKNRRQRITDEFMHMIQKGNALYTEREYRNFFGKEETTNNNYNDEIAPF